MFKFKSSSASGWSLLAVFVVALFCSQLQAAAFTAANGDLVISGSIFVDNDAVGDGSFSEAAGVGNVTEVRLADGTLFWENSASELSIAFDGFSRSALAPGLGGTTQFTSIGGTVNFFENALGTFQATGNFVADGSAISAGDFLLGLAGVADSNGNVAVGQFSPSAYASNGFLEVTGGTFASLFDTNTVFLGAGAGFADMTFNISGDNIATAGYDFSGSADLATHAVPSPEPLALLGFGCIGLAGVAGRKNRTTVILKKG